MIRVLDPAGEVEFWNVCFVRSSPWRFVRVLACGRYQHVRAFGFVPGMGLWLFYDVTMAGTAIAVARDGAAEADALIRAWIEDADVVRMRARQGNSVMRWPGFWCVPAVKSLLGLRSGALRPDALWRDCLANGGTVFDGPEAAAAGSLSAAGRPAV